MALSVLKKTILSLLLFIFFASTQAAISKTDALLLGTVQGATEFLPISSTAHLLLTETSCNISPKKLTEDFVTKGTLCTLDVVFQLGTLLATLLFYRKKIRNELLSLGKSFIGRIPLINTYCFLIFVAFLPIGIVGFSLHHSIHKFYTPKVIAYALVLGSFLMIFAEKYLQKRAAFRKNSKDRDLNSLSLDDEETHSEATIEANNPDEHLNIKSAFKIGCWQCLALIPGTSRSMSTIVGGYFQGLTRETAVTFSFLLGFVTSLVVTLYKIFTNLTFFTRQLPLDVLLCGFLSSFFIGIIVIGPCIRFLIHRGLCYFAYYRLILAALLFIYF